VVWAQRVRNLKGWELLRPHAVGIYANILSDENPSGGEQAYSDCLERLCALKNRFSPTNAFRLNANVWPSPDVTDR
jgi:hypothetical protein